MKNLKAFGHILLSFVTGIIGRVWKFLVLILATFYLWVLILFFAVALPISLIIGVVWGCYEILIIAIKASMGFYDSHTDQTSGKSIQ